MIRMEVACFLVIAFMSILYFSVKREKTKLHKYFSACLIFSMLHLIFDGLTIYTVNRLHEIPLWINDVLHRFFIGTMIIVFYLVYRYIALLIEYDTEESLGTYIYSTVCLGVGLVCTVFLPLTYVETDRGNYSFGPLAYMLYVCLTFYVFLIIVNLKRFWRRIHPKKKIAISVAMVIHLFALLYQALFPLALISGMGIMLVNLSFYLTIENPDIFLLQQIQKEKQKAEEASQAKSNFLSQMSHEIRTPMNAVVGMTESLLRTELTDQQREYLLNIKSSGNALVSIINDILDISKIEAGKMELVEDVYEIHTILNELQMIIQDQIGDKPIQLLYEIDKELPNRLYGDGMRIRQILINLLSNAVKFTEKGYIKLTIKIESKTEEGFVLYVSVADTGQGIKEEDIQRLFGAFEQVDVRKNRGKEGTGLGLAISGQLVEMMGGKLEVSSEYGVGSDFYFTILQKTVSVRQGAKKESEAESMTFTAPDARILVVDDNAMNCKVAVGLLSPLQMQIDTVDNGKDALSMIKENKYHIIFMDYMMPVMDGVETTRCLRAMNGAYYKEVPVIALTADVLKESRELFDEAGMNGFLAKPIDVRQIYNMIRKWLPRNLLVWQEKAENSQVEEIEKVKTAEEIHLEGIDTAEGIKNCGNEELFRNLLGDFYRLIDSKSVKIEKCLSDNMIKDYTIEVHALKNTARMIGAIELSKRFAYLELLGKAEDAETILRETPEVLALYRSYKPILKQYGTNQMQQRAVGTEEILNYLQGIREAIEGFDLDVADAAMKKLEECQLPEECQPFMEQLRVYVADVAMEDIIKVADEMTGILERK